ncbi:MAG: ribose-phosphate pyrophosphokinase [Alphaproteobacteria bacterium]|nr:ribose-phosphate pyrophosphokinase [Alphaproteobacteria bacterium]
MRILFAYPGAERLADMLANHSRCERGALNLHRFPDGESLIQIQSDIKSHEIAILCSLDRPDDKAVPLMFFAQTAKEFGAKSVTLIAPYLGYMRQDKRFHEGEAVTSAIFASFLSENFDSLITVDPHLHRYKNLNELYTIPTKTVHASGAIADWIGENIKNPVLIGPDEESDQWVSKVAQKAEAPYAVLQKTRRGDTQVEISVPEIDKYKDHTPVLVDDIISTARTMIETVKRLKRAGMNPPVCIGVHALFAGDAFEALKQSGAGRVVSCNTVAHETNAIDVSGLLAAAWKG